MIHRETPYTSDPSERPSEPTTDQLRQVLRAFTAPAARVEIDHMAEEEGDPNRLCVCGHLRTSHSERGACLVRLRKGRFCPCIYYRPRERSTRVA